ncbi:MAG: flippase-like domain-containing protein [Fibrobacterota bacterium]|nr:flippase-like domain-containing protein [Fibrobacterota bacterium]
MTAASEPLSAKRGWCRGLIPALKILLSLACLAAVWRWIDPAGLGEQIKGLAPLTFALAVALSLFHKVLNTVKVRLLFPPPRPDFLKILKVNFITVFFNSFLPGGIGGEIARWTYLGRESRSKSLALAVILLDRITGLWAQIFLAAAAWLWVSRDRITLWAAGPAIVTVLLGSLWAGLWGYQGLTAGLSRLGGWYARRRGDPDEAPEDISKALADLLASRSRFLRVAGLSLTSQVLVVAIFLLVDRSVGGDLGMAQGMLFLFCYTLVLLLPVTIGSWGLSEGALGIMYHYSGAQGATGVVIALLLRIMDLPAAFLGWILFLRYRSRNKTLS